MRIDKMINDCEDYFRLSWSKGAHVQNGLSVAKVASYILSVGLLPLGVAAFGAALNWHKSRVKVLSSSPASEVKQSIVPASSLKDIHEYSPLRLGEQDAFSVAIEMMPGKAEPILSELNDRKKQADVFSNCSRLKFQYKDTDKVIWICQGDMLAKGNSRAVVNAANRELGGGAGIDGAIHSAGGDEYAQAHAALKDQYPMQYTSGYAACIDGGRQLKARGINQVIVVAGPQIVGENVQPSQAQMDALYSCYLNSLMLAEQQKIECINFPSISTGIFRFPQDLAAKIALKAIHTFLSKDPPPQYVKEISIFCYKPSEKVNHFGSYWNALRGS